MEEELIITEIHKDELDKLPGWISVDIMNKVQSVNVHIIVAIIGDEIVGMLVAEVFDDIGALNVLDIYTIEEMRRTHIAGTLLLEFMDYYNEMLDYALNYAKADFNEGNKDAKAFFEALEFDIIKDETANKMIYSLEAVKNSAYLSKKYELPDGYSIISLADMDNIRYRDMIKQIEQAGGNYIDSFAAKADKSLSYSLWDSDELIAVAEIMDEGENGIVLGQFFLTKNTSALINVLQVTADEIMKKYPINTPFVVYVTEESSKNLLTKFLGENYISECLVTAVYNMTR